MLYWLIAVAIFLSGCAGYSNDYDEYPQLRTLHDNVQAPGTGAAASSSSCK